MLEYAFDDQEARGEGEGLFKLMEERRAIEGTSTRSAQNLTAETPANEEENAA